MGGRSPRNHKFRQYGGPVRRRLRRNSGLYEELKGYYSADFLFWLQYGRAEVYFDHFSVAENYLNQSLGIRDAGNFQARHYMGVLHLKRALVQEKPASAAEDAKRGEEILRHQIGQRGDVDAYPYAALVVHKLRYLKKWNPPKTGEQLEDLYKLAQIGNRKYPFDEAMREAYQEVFREYLMQAVKPRAVLSSMAPPERSEDHASEGEPK